MALLSTLHVAYDAGTAGFSHANGTKPSETPCIANSPTILQDHAHVKAASTQGSCFSLFLSAADEAYGQESCSIDAGGLDKFAALLKKYRIGIRVNLF